MPIRYAMISLGLMMILGGCGEEEPAPEVAVVSMKTISGTVTYRERIGLTSESRLQVQLLDVSKADALATEISSTVIDNPGQVPIPFSLDFDPADIDDRMTYSISAKIFDRDQLIFTSDSINPVLTRGAGNTVVVNVVRAANDKRSQDNAPVENTRWTLRSVYGKQVLATDGPAPYLQLHGASKSAIGFAGCNRFTGDFSLSGDALKLDSVASTMMACTEGEEIERSFLQALGELDSVRVEGRTLQALAAGQLIATFDTEPVVDDLIR